MLFCFGYIETDPRRLDVVPALVLLHPVLRPLFQVPYPVSLAFAKNGTIPTRSGQVVFVRVQGDGRDETNSPPLGGHELACPYAGCGRVNGSVESVYGQGG